MNLHTSLRLRLATLFLLCFPLFLAAQSPSILRYENCKFNTQNLGVPAGYAMNETSKNPPHWGYHFYDFGDGHYAKYGKKNGRPCHLYKNGQPKSKPTLYLTPFKSIDPVKTVVCQSPIRLGGSQACSDEYDVLEDEKIVGIVTNSGEKIIAGHEVQCVVHYKAPNDLVEKTEGYLFVFYNRKRSVGNDKELLVDNALEWVGYKDYYSEQPIGDISLIQNDLSDYVSGEIYRQKSSHHQLEIFKATIERGKEKRFFFSVKSDKALTDFQDKDRTISITSVWVPLGKKSFNAKNQVAVHVMGLDAVHDPNRITVYPRVAYQAKGCPQKLTYKVEFENETKTGIVDEVKVHLSSNGKLDKTSIRVTESKPPCPPCQNVPNGTPCHEIITEKDSLLFVFRKIGLEGTKGSGLGNKRAKGFVKFTINTTDKRQGTTVARADIVFNKNKGIATNVSKVLWREKNVKLHLGYNRPINTDFFSFSDSLPDLLSVGLVFQNAPVGKGLSRGLELQYNPLRLFSDTTYTVTNGETLGTINQTENVKLHLIEASYFIGFQPVSFLGIKAGIGLTTPIVGKAAIRANYSTAQTDEEINSTDEIKFGLAQQTENASLFDNDIATQKMFGYKLSLQAEVFDVSRFALGLRYDRRYFPKLYRGANCLHINSLQAYVRFKLKTKKGKCK